MAGYNEPGSNIIIDYQDSTDKRIEIQNSDKKILSFRANTFAGSNFNELNISNVKVKPIDFDMDNIVSLNKEKRKHSLTLPGDQDLFINFNAHAQEDFSIAINKQKINIKHYPIANTMTPYWLTLKRVMSGSNTGRYHATAGIGTHPGSNIIYDKILPVTSLSTIVEMIIGSKNAPVFINDFRATPLTPTATSLFGLIAPRYSSPGAETTINNSMIAAPSNPPSFNWQKTWAIPLIDGKANGTVTWQIAAPSSTSVVSGLGFALLKAAPNDFNATKQPQLNGDIGTKSRPLIDGHTNTYNYCIKIDTDGRGTTGLYSSEGKLLSSTVPFCHHLVI